MSLLRRLFPDRRVWFVLEKGKKARGPFTRLELQEHYNEEYKHKGLKIRKGKHGEWQAWPDPHFGPPGFPPTKILAKRSSKKTGGIAGQPPREKRQGDTTRLERLVRRLISFTDEATFLDALREATGLAQKGNALGVRALSEAIRRKSRKREVMFCTEPLGGFIWNAINKGKNVQQTSEGITTVSLDSERWENEKAEAEHRLLDLAKSQALLEDPGASQKLISVLWVLGRNDDLRKFLHRIYDVGGVEQGYAFQLLFNHMQSFVTLRKKRL